MICTFNFCLFIYSAYFYSFHSRNLLQVTFYQYFTAGTSHSLHFKIKFFHALYLRIFFSFKDFLLNNIELLTTLTELKAIAPPAMTGLSSQPVKGYSTPAATGI